MKSSRGFTTIELLIVVAIIAVLVALAIPSFTDFFEKGRLRGAAEMVYEQLMFAKSQAIKRSKTIMVDFSADGGSSWWIGVTDDTSDDDPAVHSNTCNASTAPSDDGDLSDEYDVCTVDEDNDPSTTADLIAIRIDGSNNKNIKMASPAFYSSVDPTNLRCPFIDPTTKLRTERTTDPKETCFDPVRGSAHEGNIVLTSQNYTLEVRVNASGKIRICVPTGKPAFAGYPDC